MAIRALACPIDGARTVEGGGHLGVTAVNGSGVVAGGDAGVSVTEAGGSGHDPMPFRDPGGMRRPERVRSEARHASSAGSWVEVGLTPGRVVQRAPRPPRGEQQCVRRGQLPEQRPERLDDEAGQSHDAALVILGSVKNVPTTQLRQRLRDDEDPLVDVDAASTESEGLADSQTRVGQEHDEDVVRRRHLVDEAPDLLLADDPWLSRGHPRQPDTPARIDGDQPVVDGRLHDLREQPVGLPNT
jgi:hypothetical protein